MYMFLDGRDGIKILSMYTLLCFGTALLIRLHLPDRLPGNGSLFGRTQGISIILCTDLARVWLGIWILWLRG